MEIKVKRYRRTSAAGSAPYLRLISFAIILMFSVVGSQLCAATSEDGGVAGLKPKFGDVAGIRTRYYEMGQGEPMLLIHGGGWASSSNANNFSTVIPGLANRFHVRILEHQPSKRWLPMRRSEFATITAMRMCVEGRGNGKHSATHALASLQNPR